MPITITQVVVLDSIVNIGGWTFTGTMPSPLSAEPKSFLPPVRAHPPLYVFARPYDIIFDAACPADIPGFGRMPDERCRRSL
jgi:hypothetical protein